VATTQTTCDACTGRAVIEDLLPDFLAWIIDYRRQSEATAQAYRRDCARFIDWLAQTGRSLDPEAIRPRDVRLFLSSLRDLAPSTVRRTLYGLSAFFRYLHDLEIIDRNPAAPVDPPKIPRRLPRVPDKAECARMLEACDTPTETAIIGLLLFAGLRRSEALGLEVADVAADLSSLRVNGKGDRERTVPVCSQLRDILSSHLRVRTGSQSPALLLNAVGQRMHATTLYRIFRRVLGRAGLADAEITPHKLRHTFASTLVRNGVDIATIGDLLGHANVSTTSIYLHSSPHSRADAVEKLSFGHCEDERGPQE